MRKNIVAGNWKMNCDILETYQFLDALKEQEMPDDVSVIVAPPFTNLQSANQALLDTEILVAAQNMHQAEKGAFTGEVSASMLKSVGVDTVILGHSERRAMFLETNEILATKVSTAIVNEMTIVFCFGEQLEDRKSGTHFDVVKEQLADGVFHIAKENWNNVILAYEPVWAIGTGKTASPEQAQEMHQFVRNTLADVFDTDVSEGVSILYGGSVKPGNAKEIFSKEDVDGGLIGGAALNAADFMTIIHSFD
jgi:triosephosphate isomerase